jgi:hypothetical protein
VEVQHRVLKLEEAFEKLSDSGLANETAYNLAPGKSKDDTFWSVMSSDVEGEKKGWRMKSFGMSIGATRN